ncbi:hypothetical protein L249_5276 [Ophiocordyceps polyrhachis-furcata BCC 54312]|uniref:Uncharacterized protein n=1 Tax=Ophiocordyceps polyrhachis-furcata BCC 54312 TaxID=1330021 RepID=A0A367L9B5_9HYPO|nr:hypothetical protein L249_5276 [Ophiocordyceps polyrhachis-furcata BCC 54312]
MAPNVNRPTDPQEKEADINRKLQLYGIFSAFQLGKVPSNDQIDVALNSALASKALSEPDPKLSDDGKLLIKDTRDVIQKAQHLILSKNEGNLIQDFIWQTTQFDTKSIHGPDRPIDKDTVKRDGDETLKGMRTLGTLIITNGQFRKLLKDASVLLRDMAGDAASNAATFVRPSEDQLAQMDTAAPDNTWYDAPDMSKDKLKKRAQNMYSGTIKKDAKEVAEAGIDAATPAASSDPRAVNKTAGQNAVMSAAKHKIDENLDPETKEKIKKRNEEYRAKAKAYFEKKMPQERKDQLIFRLKKMILECQQHQDYSEAIQTLLRLAETYGRHGRSMGEGSAGSAKKARSGFSAAEADLRTLIERFANGTSTGELWSSIHQIYEAAEKDHELKGWFKSMNSYIRRCLLEQGYILEDSSSREWDRLYDHGRFLLRDKYRSQTDQVIGEVKFIGDQFDQDVHNKAFAQSVQKLFTHLGSDADGKSTFKPHLLKDFGELILPGLLMNINYIPIPRIEYVDPQFEAVVENLVLESDNFMPNVLEVVSNNFFRLGRKNLGNKNHNMIDVKVAGIQMDLRDINYYVKRKTGFPSISDTGIMDILLPGNGLSFRMKVSTADKKDRQNFFKVNKVDVDFKGLNIKLKKSHHKFLFALVKPLLLTILRPPIQKAVEKAIKDQCNKLDSEMYQIKLEADRAAQEGQTDAEKQENFYKRYYQAAQKRFTQAKDKEKEKVEKEAEDKKVNVAMTMEDSILPEVKLPSGVSTKATEYKELARKGEKWESPVFSIGSAKKSTDVPSAPRIEKKTRPPPRTTNGNSAAAAVNGKAPVTANANLPGQAHLSAY